MKNRCNKLRIFTVSLTGIGLSGCYINSSIVCVTIKVNLLLVSTVFSF